MRGLSVQCPVWPQGCTCAPCATQLTARQTTSVRLVAGSSSVVRLAGAHKGALVFLHAVQFTSIVTTAQGGLDGLLEGLHTRRCVLR